MEMEYNGTLSWDMTEATVTNNEYVVLKPGDYPFTVKGFTRGQWGGSEKMPPCPMAELELAIKHEGSEVIVKDRIFLLKSIEWKISQFFKSIGAPVNPETNKVSVNWNNVLGAEGMVTIVNEPGSKGGTFNKIKKYLEPTYKQQAPAQTLAPQTGWGSNGGWK